MSQVLFRAARVVLIVGFAATLCRAGGVDPLQEADRLAVRAKLARETGSTLRAYLLYSEALRLNPLKASYLENVRELEPLAKLLTANKLETADISADMKAAEREATPGSDASVAVRLAVKAEKAGKAGRPVRAYLLYAAASARDPQNAFYRETRDALAPAAGLPSHILTDQTDISADIKAAEVESLIGPDPSMVAAGANWEQENSLAGLPHVLPTAAHHDFDIRGDELTLIKQVTEAYGIKTICDPDLKSTGPQGELKFEIGDADFKTAMEALTVVTGTFVFPVSPQVVFFAKDTEQKRNELEPTVVLTMALPNSLGEKDLIEAANAVRSVLNLRSFGWDSTNHSIIIRDRFTRVHVARSLLESLLLPKGQVSLEVQFLTLDDQTSYHYGLGLQGSYQLINFGHLGHFQSIVSAVTTAANFMAFGGGASLLGIGVTDSTLFATYSKSFTHAVYEATVTVQDGETANFHVGEKYPIPQSLYTGAALSAPSIYNPVGQFEIEDLGLVLKMTAHIRGSGDVGLSFEAEYKSLGTQTFNTVPSVSQRKYTGDVVLREGEWAVLTGLDERSVSRSRNGIAGLGDIPGLGEALSENTRTKEKSETLVVIKPVITRLPMSGEISPQFLMGTVRGVKVLL